MRSSKISFYRATSLSCSYREKSLKAAGWRSKSSDMVGSTFSCEKIGTLANFYGSWTLIVNASCVVGHLQNSKSLKGVRLKEACSSLHKGSIGLSFPLKFIIVIIRHPYD